MKASVLLIACAVVVSACATPGLGDRTRLTRDELGSMRPQIAEHLTCMARKVGVYAGGAADLGVLVDTAAYTCKQKLNPLAVRLKEFDLTPDAQTNYVRAIEMASRSIIADRILKAQARAPGRSDHHPAGS